MEEPPSENCPICLVPLTDTPEAGSGLLKTPCQHIFHHQCLSEWFRSGVPGDYCPLCKLSMRAREAVLVSPSGNELPASEVSELEVPVSEPQREDGFTEEQLEIVTQYFSEMQQLFLDAHTTLEFLNESFSQSNQSISDSIQSSTMSSQEKQMLEPIIQGLFEIRENLGDAERSLSEALEIVAGVRQRGVESLDRNMVREMMDNLKSLRDNARQKHNNAMETQASLQGMLETMLFQRVRGGD